MIVVLTFRGELLQVAHEMSSATRMWRDAKLHSSVQFYQPYGADRILHPQTAKPNKVNKQALPWSLSPGPQNYLSP